MKKLLNLNLEILKREDPTYLLKAIKNKTEIDNMIKSHVTDGVALTKFIYWIKKVNKKKNYRSRCSNKIRKI